MINLMLTKCVNYLLLNANRGRVCLGCRGVGTWTVSKASPADVLGDGEWQ